MNRHIVPLQIVFVQQVKAYNGFAFHYTSRYHYLPTSSTIGGIKGIEVVPRYRYFHGIAKYATIAQTQVDVNGGNRHAKRSQSADQNKQPSPRSRMEVF